MNTTPFGGVSGIDETIIEAKAGSTRAFTTLYHTFAGEIASFCRARGVRQVDEVVNDVFLGAFRGLSRFEGDAAAFRAYLYRVTRNKISDERTAYRRERDHSTPLDGLNFDLTDTGIRGRADDAAIANLDAHQLKILLEMLTPDQRDVILLRFLAGLTVPEVCNVIGKPTTAVKALQRRGLATLLRLSSAGAVSV